MSPLPALLLALSLLACGDKDDDDDEPGDGGAADGGADGGADDRDEDGYVALAAGGDDCDDTNPNVHPGATEVCNAGRDDDCDGLADDDDDSLDRGTASTWFTDRDADLYGDDASTALACEAPAGSVAVGGDCDDGDASTNPGATEICNEHDDDCDELVDDADDSLDLTTASSWHSDNDRDGYGQEGGGTLSCLQPPDTAGVGGDCDDADPTVHPGAAEVCNGRDDDCDEATGEDGLVSIGTTLYDSIQAAASAAAASDTVQVCAGTYVENVTTGAFLRLEGVAGSDRTVIRGAGVGAVLTLGGDLELAGVTLTNGAGETGGGIDGYSAGGGAVVIEDCVVTGNSADFGGGVLVYGGALTVRDCEIHGNTATTSGGGVYAVELVVEGSAIHDNTAAYGGGVYLETGPGALDAASSVYDNDASAGLGGGLCAITESTVVADDTVFSGNSALYGGAVYLERGAIEGGTYTANTARYSGGGLLLVSTGPVARGVVVYGNTAAYGAGVSIEGTDAVLEEAEVYENEAASYGGGVLLPAGGEAELSAVRIEDNVAPLGGGLYLEQDNLLGLVDVELRGNTAEDDGGGLYADSALVELRGGSVASNRAGSLGGGAYLARTTLWVEGSDWGERDTENSPDDVYVEDAGVRYSGYGADASFTCEDTGCR